MTNPNDPYAVQARAQQLETAYNDLCQAIEGRMTSFEAAVGDLPEEHQEALRRNIDEMRGELESTTPQPDSPTPQPEVPPANTVGGAGIG